jgi:hypothetical protein
MPALSEAELLPGVVLQVDADALRATGRARTNAEVAGALDRAVQGPHSFLVLEVNGAQASALLMPIFSEWAPGSEALREGEKSGWQLGWAATTLFVSRWQHWEAPLADIAVHSGLELTQPGQRRHYAAANPAELARLSAFKLRNRAPWRQLT